MKDLFAGFNSNNLVQNFQNPLTIAGLAVMQGAPMGQALIAATELSRQNQLAQAQMAEHQAKLQAALGQKLFGQNLAQQLPNIKGNNVSDLLAQLMQIPGSEFVESGKVLDLAKGINPEIQDKIVADEQGGYHIIPMQNGKVVGEPISMGTGAGNGNNNIIADLLKQRGIDYNQLSSAGRKKAEDLVLNSVIKPGETINREDRKNYAKMKLDASTSASTSKDELRILNDLEQAFKEFDEASNYFTKSGSFLTRPTALEKGGDVAFDKKQAAAYGKIVKLNSQLYQVRVNRGGKNATDAFKAEVKAGLPQPYLQPEAREEIIVSKRREANMNNAKNKFYIEWNKQNKGDMGGADEAFETAIHASNYFDNKGNLNPSFDKDIPALVKELSSPEETIEDIIIPNSNPALPAKGVKELEPYYGVDEDSIIRALERKRGK